MVGFRDSYKFFGLEILSDGRSPGPGPVSLSFSALKFHGLSPLIRGSNRAMSQSSSRSLSRARTVTPAHSSITRTASGRRSRAASSLAGSNAHHVICAISEARGVGQTVGIAFINISTGEAVLSQICDTQSYVKTTHKLKVFEPSRVLIISTACAPHPKSSLCATIEEELPGTPVIPLDRKYWSETAGLEYIQSLAFRQDVETIKVAIYGKFYATSSFSAVSMMTTQI